MSTALRGGLGLVAAAGAVALALGLSGFRADRVPTPTRPDVPVSSAKPRVGTPEAYAGSESCRACHEDAYRSWHRSHHRTMTQLATPQTVRAAFDGRRLGTHRVGRDGQEIWVELPGPEGRPERREIELVTGSHHMQVYWMPDPAGDRLVAFPWAWLIEDEQWVPNEATLLRPPGIEVEYTWNRVCIKCHVVAGNPGWDEDAQRVRSSVAELGIACEACHGPGRAHVDRQRDPLRRTLAWIVGDEVDDVVHPLRMDAPASSELCGQCHAITLFHDDAAWVRGGHDHPPPAPMAAWGRLVRHPSRADQPWLEAVLDDNPDFFAERFWSDGMVRVSGREYNGLVESACHERGGLSCATCHSMHDAPPDDQLRPEATGDEVCTSCHGDIAGDVQGHSRHRAGASHPSCQDCHMPHTTYGLLKAIRSHEIDSPRVQVTLDTGRPNACNLCHLDQTLAWTAEHLSAWYGHPRPALDADDDAGSAALRWLLAGDAGQRALLAWHLGWAPALAVSGRDWQVPSLRILADDPYPAVRTIAERSLRRLALEQGEGTATRPAGWWDPELARSLLGSRDDRPVSLAE